MAAAEEHAASVSRHLLPRTISLWSPAGIPRPSLFIIDVDAPNASTVGLSPANASLTVTRGLVRLLDRQGVEAVLVRELSHIASYDSRLKTFLATGVALLSLPLWLLFSLPRSPARRSHLVAGMGPIIPVFLFLVPISLVAAPTDLGSDSLVLYVVLFYYMALPMWLPQVVTSHDLFGYIAASTSLALPDSQARTGWWARSELVPAG
jgi:hypothetical protein